MTDFTAVGISTFVLEESKWSSDDIAMFTNIGWQAGVCEGFG